MWKRNQHKHNTIWIFKFITNTVQYSYKHLPFIWADNISYKTLAFLFSQTSYKRFIFYLLSTKNKLCHFLEENIGLHLGQPFTCFETGIFLETLVFHSNLSPQKWKKKPAEQAVFFFAFSSKQRQVRVTHNKIKRKKKNACSAAYSKLESWFYLACEYSRLSESIHHLENES